MMTRTFLLAVIFQYLIIQSGTCQYTDYLRMLDTKSGWKGGVGSISYAEFILKPMDNFVWCDLYMTYLQDVPFYSNPKDTSEIQHYFTLPENILVVDSWLWVDDKIMKADIIERSQAFNIYEGLVKRRIDPSVLYKNSPTSYEFRIFPIPGQKTRRVKLSFIIPYNRFKDNDLLSLPVSIINSSRVKPDIVIKIQNTTPEEILLNTSIPWEAEKDSLLGDYIKTKIISSEYTNLKVFDLKFDRSYQPVLLNYTIDNATGDEGAYQLSMDPVKLLGIQTHNHRNVIIYIDHESTYSTLSKSDIKKGLKYFIQNTLSPTDSIQIIYNNLEIKKTFSDFVSVDKLNASGEYEVWQPGDFSLMITGLFEAYQIAAKKRNAFVVVFSSGASFTNPTQAQSIKNTLLETFKSLPKTFFHDYANSKAPTFNFDNSTIRGNGLLYRIISTNTGGAYTASGINYKDYYSWLPGLNEISLYFDDLSSKLIEIDLRIKPENGFTFENYLLKNTRSGFMQIGRFRGAPPFTIESVILEDTTVYNKKITINDAHSSEETDLYHQIHTGHKILKLEKDNLTANRSKIVNLSIANRILSRFTAFLALEPTLQQPCTDCTDESSTGTEDNESKSMHIVSYPNPFFETCTLEITGIQAGEKVNSVQLYNVMGQEQPVTYTLEQKGEKWLVHINGSLLPAGVYIVKILIGKKIYTYKVIKVR